MNARFPMTRLTGFAIAATATAAVFWPSFLHAGEIESTARSLQSRYSGALVPLVAVVDVTMEFNGQTRNNESTIDTLGTIIDDSGLIVTAHSNLKASSQIPGAPPGMQIKVKSELKGIKVIWPDGTESEAASVLNDPDLDLTFIRAEGKNQGTSTIPFDANTITIKSAKILDQIVMLSRQPVSLERVPRVETGRIAAVIEKPLAFLVPNIGTPGSPAFHESGKLLGLFANKIQEGKAPARIILPAEQVVKVAAQVTQAAEKEPAAGESAGGESRSLAEVAEEILDKSRDSVVSLIAVLSRNEREREVSALGTIMDADGLIVTANSNFRGGNLESIKVIADDGSEIDAKVLLENPDLDLMFLEADKASAEEQGVELVPAPFEDALLQLGAADPILILSREPAAFFRQPKIELTRIDSVIEEPRRYYRTPQKTGGAPGFNSSGQLVGIYARRVSGDVTRHRMLLPCPTVLKAAAEARGEKKPEAEEKPDPEEKEETEDDDEDVI